MLYVPSLLETPLCPILVENPFMSHPCWKPLYVPSLLETPMYSLQDVELDKGPLREKLVELTRLFTHNFKP